MTESVRLPPNELNRTRTLLRLCYQARTQLLELCDILTEQRERALAEVERLRGEVARRDEQIAAVRALHAEEIDRGDPTGYCRDCEQRFPCNTANALASAS